MKAIKRHQHPAILSFEDGLAIASNGNLIMPYRVELPEIYSLSEVDFEALHGTWFQAIKALPPGAWSTSKTFT